MTQQQALDEVRRFVAACQAAILLAKDDQERTRYANLYDLGLDAVSAVNKHALEQVSQLLEVKP
jgi:hypothetical protein